MKKIIFGLFAVMSVFAYSQEIDLWEKSSPTVSMGYTGFEIGGKYYNKSIKNVNEIQRFLDEVYSLRNTINNDLKERAIFDTQEKDWILNTNVSYLKYENLKTPIYSINYGVLNDITRYGLSLSMFDGDSKLKVREYDTTGGQVNLYFNRNEELGNFFGTLYIGKNRQEFKENTEDIDNLYYGYFTSLEQKYESFNIDEFYSGYFLNLDISKVETDYNLAYNGKTLKAEIDSDSIDTEFGILFKKIFYVAMDTQVSVKLASSIGKEFKDENKYKEQGKEEFEFYNKNKLEIISKIGTSGDIFTGIEYRKSMVTSNSENNIYLGFKINF